MLGARIPTVNPAPCSLFLDFRVKVKHNFERTSLEQEVVHGLTATAGYF
jgi:hypothetical protein